MEEVGAGAGRTAGTLQAHGAALTLTSMDTCGLTSLSNL